MKLIFKDLCWLPLLLILLKVDAFRTNPDLKYTHVSAVQLHWKPYLSTRAQWVGARAQLYKCVKYFEDGPTSKIKWVMEEHVTNMLSTLIIDPFPNTPFWDCPKFKEATDDNWNVANKGF